MMKIIVFIVHNKYETVLEHTIMVRIKRKRCEEEGEKNSSECRWLPSKKEQSVYNNSNDDNSKIWKQKKKTTTNRPSVTHAHSCNNKTGVVMNKFTTIWDIL